jgi:Tol biopolymer transport system component
VWLVHPDGTEDHALETDLDVSILLPDWSPDGSKLVFTSRGGETEPLYEFDLASEETIQLFECTDTCLGDDEPAYSRDGRSVAFIRYLAPFVGDAPSDCGLWVGDRESGRVRQLTSNKTACDREYFPR